MGVVRACVTMLSEGTVAPSVRKDVGGEAADRNALRVALFTAAVCAALIVLSGIFMQMHLDQRVMLTTVSVFSDWGGLRRIYMDVASYDPRFNLQSLEYYSTFETAASSLQVVQDLVDRGLVGTETFTNASRLFNLTTGFRLVDPIQLNQLQQVLNAFFTLFGSTIAGNPPPPSVVVPSPFGSQDPRLLPRLMRVSGCSFPDAMPGFSPWDRSAGCHCIANAYVSFVNSTVNMAGNVTVSAREAAASDTMRCLDRRVTWHAWAAGKDWSIHPLGLALYGNCVMFLVSVSFILTYYAAQWEGRPILRLWAVKGGLVLLTGGLSVFFWAHDAFANIFLLVGLMLTLGTLTLSAQSVLNRYVETGGGRVIDRGAPHPLLVCFWLNVPQILPALLVSVAIGGYIRDLYAVWAVAVIGSVAGNLMQVSSFSTRFIRPSIRYHNRTNFSIVVVLWQRLFWILWYGCDVFMSLIVPPLIFALFDLTVLMGILLIVYRNDSDVYAMSGVVIIVGFFLYLLSLWGLLRYEYRVHRVRKGNGFFMDQVFDNDRHTPLFVMTLAVLSWTTIVGIMDVQKR